MRKPLTWFVILACFAACSSEQKPADPVPPAQGGAALPGGAAAAAAELGPAVFDVMCGCSIAGIGKCGNYIRIDGKYVPMLHPSLGKMEFCAQKAAGAKVEAAGTMNDGKFVAKQWKLAP